MKKYWGDVLNHLAQNGQRTINLQISETKPKYSLKNESCPKKKIEKNFLGDQYPGIYFTQRETECMKLLSKGFTLLRIAETLKLSPRTIEFYVKNMKMKLHCHNKAELVEKIILLNFQKDQNERMAEKKDGPG